MDNNLEQQIFESRRRNLRIILVLSIIGSGFNFISYLMTGLTLPFLKTMYQTGSMTFPSEMTVYVEQIFDTPRSFFLCIALLYGLSLTGVILMWNLRKSGFHLYTLAQLLVLLVTLLFLGRERVPLGNIMFTMLFIIYYYIALRNLGVFSRTVYEPADNSDDDNPNSTYGNGGLPAETESDAGTGDRPSDEDSSASV